MNLESMRRRCDKSKLRWDHLQATLGYNLRHLDKKPVLEDIMSTLLLGKL